MQKFEPRFVRRAQIFLCDFEACCNKSDCTICHPGFSANIKPEIGKVRPVVIVRPHKRHRLALAVPFTTQRPTKEVSYTVEIPLGVMPGKLRHNKCWALCDMVSVVNLARLQRVYRQDLQESFIGLDYYKEIIAKIHKNIGSADLSKI